MSQTSDHIFISELESRFRFDREDEFVPRCVLRDTYHDVEANDHPLLIGLSNRQGEHFESWRGVRAETHLLLIVIM